MGQWAQDPMLVLSTSRSVAIYVVGFIEAMLFGGAVFGWPQLVHVLKVEGVYSNLCTPSTPVLHVHKEQRDPIPPPFNNTRCVGLNSSFAISNSHAVSVEQCREQDAMFAIIYTVTICCYSIPGVLVGLLLHYAGLWVTRISAGLMLCAGFIFLGVVSREQPWFVFPAMVLLALGGNQTRLSAMQFGDLFPFYRSTAITLLSGVYAASAALFLVFQLTEQAGIKRAHVCWVLAAISSLTVFSTFMMPFHHIPVQEDREAHLPDPTPLPLAKSLLSVSSGLHQLWFFVTLFSINSYQQQYNVWINAVSCDVDQAGTLSAAFSYSCLFTVFIGPLAGIFTDRMVARAAREKDDMCRRVKEVQASFWPLLMTSVALTCMHACLLFFLPSAVYLSLVLMVVARPCVIAVSTAYLRIRFHADHFNRLLGVYNTTTAILLFLEYPHFKWVMSQGMYYPAQVTVLVALLVSYLNPIHLLFTPLMRSAIMTRDHITKQDLMPRSYSLSQSLL